MGLLAIFTSRIRLLQNRVGASLGALILVLALLLAFALSETAERQVLLQSATNLESLSNQMSRELATGMDRFTQAVVTQTYRDRFRDPNASVESLREALDQFKRTNPEFSYVSVIDVATAKVVAANGGIFEGGDTTGRPTFERGKEGVFVGDVHDAVRLAELLPKPENGEALRFLDVAAPVTDPGGKVFRVFATHVGWNWTDSLRKDIFGPVRTTSGIEAILVDSLGKVVLSANPSLKVGSDLGAIAARDGSPTATVRWPDGQDYLTDVAATAPHGHFPGFGWKVVARQPADVAVAAAHSLRIAFMSGALALGLAGAALAWFISGRLMRPIRLLAEEAARAQSGAKVATLQHARPSEEVSAVHEAISKLADTARAQAQATASSQQLFEALANSLPQIVFQVDALGRIDHVNEGWLSKVKAAGPFALADLQESIDSSDRPRFDQTWATAFRQEADLRVRCRVMLTTTDTAIWMDIEARVVERVAGVTRRWVATMLDVHEIVTRAEDSLIALEQERSARLEAERSAKLRDEFLATVSHELRSPLSAITGWSEILRRRNKTNEPVLKAAEIIARNARVQARLIDDLLDITAVMAGKLILDTAPVDVIGVAGEVVASRQDAARAKGIRLAYSAHPPLTVDGDRQRIAQVLDNLVGNAIKFTDAGGTVEVVASSEKGFAVLRVRDTGRGIEPSFIPHVFERMRQEDSSKTRKAGGLGLGLAIVQGLVTLHEGWVKVESEGLGRGSMFTVALPLGETLETPAAPAEGGGAADESTEIPDNELRGLRVLLVDDEADAREVAHVALSSLGAEVRAAASGAEVLRVLQESRFDVLVSDIGMPDMDGLTLIRAVRRLPNGSAADMPAIALTAFAMESDRRLGIEAGFQAYVTKPLSIRRLSEAVMAAIRAKQAA